MHDPIALRVAQRHAAVVLRDVPTTRTRLDFTDSGRITAHDLAKMLAPTTGRLLRVEFRRALDGPFGAVAWEALDEDANLVSGKLVLHAALAEMEVVSWAEVTVDRA